MYHDKCFRVKGLRGTVTCQMRSKYELYQRHMKNWIILFHNALWLRSLPHHEEDIFFCLNMVETLAKSNKQFISYVQQFIRFSTAYWWPLANTRPTTQVVSYKILHLLNLSFINRFIIKIHNIWICLITSFLLSDSTFKQDCSHINSKYNTGILSGWTCGLTNQLQKICSKCFQKISTGEPISRGSLILYPWHRYFFF